MPTNSVDRRSSNRTTSALAGMLSVVGLTAVALLLQPLAVASTPAGSSLWAFDVDAAPGGLAADCEVYYRYNSSDRIRQLTRGQQLTLNQTDMAYVENKTSRPLRVHVTVPSGGSKWLALSRGQRDPSGSNYAGNVTLKAVSCEYLYPSAATMVGQLRADGKSPSEIGTMVKNEFEVTLYELADAVYAPWKNEPNNVAAALKSGFPGSSTQVATELKRLSFNARSVKTALSAAYQSDEVTLIGWLRAAGFSGTDVFDALQWSLGGSAQDVQAIDGIVASMKDGGYSARDVTQGMHAIHPQAYNGISGVGFYLRRHYRLYDVVTALETVKGATAAQAIGGVTSGGFSGSGLNAVESSAGEVANVIKRVYGANAGMLVSYLREGYGETVGDLEDTLEGMNAAFNRPTAAIMAGYLRSGGTTPRQVGGALKNDYGQTQNQAAATLRQSGHNASQAAEALRHTFATGNPVTDSQVDNMARALASAGYGATETARGIKAAVPSSTASQIARAIKHGFNDSTKTANALRSVYRANGPDVARYMKESSHGTADAAEGLLEAFSSTPGRVTPWLKTAPWNAEQTTRALKNAFNQTAQQATLLLKANRFTDAEIVTAVRTHYTGTSSREVTAWLRGK